MNRSGDHNDIYQKLDLCRTDPKRYLDMFSRRIDADPLDPGNYFDRHHGWMQINEPRRALADLDKVIDLDPRQITFLVRGRVHRHLGEYEDAIADFRQGEKINPEQWQSDAMGLLYQADCYARLGHEAEALSCCSRLPDDFWTPGPRGTPAGNKTQIAEELRQLAEIARTGQDRDIGE